MTDVASEPTARQRSVWRALDQPLVHYNRANKNLFTHFYVQVSLYDRYERFVSRDSYLYNLWDKWHFFQRDKNVEARGLPSPKILSRWIELIEHDLHIIFFLQLFL